MKLNEFLAMTLEERRRARVRPKPRGPYKRRPARTPEEMVECLRNGDMRSARQLRAKRKPDDPNLYDITKAFGSWRAAKELAFGKPDPFSLPRRPDPEFILKAALEFDLQTRDAYAAARRRRPDVLPSVYWIRVLFGSWDRLKWAVEQVSIKACVDRWMALRRRLGRSPTLDEINQSGVSLEPLKPFYTTRADLNALFKRLNDVADKMEKATGQKSSDV